MFLFYICWYGDAVSTFTFSNPFGIHRQKEFLPSYQWLYWLLFQRQSFMCSATEIEYLAGRWTFSSLAWVIHLYRKGHSHHSKFKIKKSSFCCLVSPSPYIHIKYLSMYLKIRAYSTFHNNTFLHVTWKPNKNCLK